MKRSMCIFLLLFTLTGCKVSFNMVNSNGKSSDLIDDNDRDKSEVDVSTSANL